MSSPNSPELTSWIEVSADSDFPIQNLPFGMARIGLATVAVSAIGDKIINLDALQELGYLAGIDLPEGIFEGENLNPFISLGQPVWRAVRQRLSDLLRSDSKGLLKSTVVDHAVVLREKGEVEMIMPVKVGDYTDFYSSEEHATNVGTMFRGKENALMPNWKHLPVGYHGRASSIVVSDTDIRRPKGQRKNAEGEIEFGPTRLMDFELEMAFVIGKGTSLGDTVSTAEAEDYIFGLTLFNDWSARDIQAWEYVPLGPFLGKNFGSTVSPWIITLDALEPFRVAGKEQNPPVLPYLQTEGERNFDIHLEVDIQPENGEPFTVCKSNHKHLYWSIAQQLAHHTVNGCDIHVGDMMASGTISGPEEGSFGSMLEITWRGANPVQMPDGSERKFIHDGDTVIIRGWCEKDGVRIGFGEARGKIVS